MFRKQFLRFYSFIILLFFVTGCTGVPKNAIIQINEQTDGYELSVPVRNLVMTIPKGRFMQTQPLISVGGLDNPRYFYYEDKENKTIISGWFEPDHKFPGLKALWDDRIKSWSSINMRSPQDVSFNKIGNWDVITYTRDVKENNISNLHISAHWVQSGTWIDVHISKMSDDSSDKARSKLIELLKTIQVREK